MSANYELQSNSHHHLPYEKTQWGQFYEDYKTCNQNQLQKHILKTENERKNWLVKNPYESLKICQHIFKYSHYENERYSTPKILLRSNGEKNHLKVGCQVLTAYLERQEKELEEVKAFYEQRKAEIATSLKAHRKEHANEIIQCPICLAKVSRTGISKHKKTIKCQSVLQEANYLLIAKISKKPRLKRLSGDSSMSMSSGLNFS